MILRMLSDPKNIKYVNLYDKPENEIYENDKIMILQIMMTNPMMISLGGGEDDIETITRKKGVEEQGKKN